LTAEWPQALFTGCDNAYHEIVYYEGASPWSQGAVTNRIVAEREHLYITPTESWVANINPAVGKGLGIYCPSAPVFWEESNWPDGGSFINSPNWSHNFSPSDRDWEQTFYLAVGTVDDIRQAFYGVAGHSYNTSPHVPPQSALRLFTYNGKLKTVGGKLKVR
jgi:hypothetical protein